MGKHFILAGQRKQHQWLVKLHDLHSRSYCIGMFVDAKEGAETEDEKHFVADLADLFHRLGDKLFLDIAVYERLRTLADRWLPNVGMTQPSK